VILPARNRRDLDEIPESVRTRLEFVWAERIEDVLARALESATAARAPEPAAELESAAA
jgi:ATP-dependent Lon protease